MKCLKFTQRLKKKSFSLFENISLIKMLWVLRYILKEMYYGTTCVYVNQKTRIKCTKNRIQLWMIKIAHIKKLQVCAWPWDIGLISMYEVVLLFFYCWQFIVLKNRPQCSSTKILHSLTNDKQTCLLQSPFKPIFPICFYQCDFVIKIYNDLPFPMEFIHQNSYFSLNKQ